MPPFDMMTWLFGNEKPWIGILDIGAVQVGKEAAPYHALVKAGSARVVGFEPDGDGCEKLNKTFGEPHHFYPFFIGDGHPATFYETNWGPTGSLFRPNREVLEKFQNLHELVTLKKEHSVETKRLDDLEALGDIDFIKIDVQGAELSVFQNGTRVLQNATIVQTEVEFIELYQGQPLFADVDKHLRANGFQFHTFHGFGTRCFKPLIVNNNINVGIKQMLWSDAVYVKDWLHLSAIPAEKLKKMAILLHEVFASFDLCHFVLSQLDVKEGTQFAAQYMERLMKN